MAPCSRQTRSRSFRRVAIFRPGRCLASLAATGSPRRPAAVRCPARLAGRKLRRPDHLRCLSGTGADVSGGLAALKASGGYLPQDGSCRPRARRDPDQPSAPMPLFDGPDRALPAHRARRRHARSARHGHARIAHQAAARHRQGITGIRARISPRTSASASAPWKTTAARSCTR